MNTRAQTELFVPLGKDREQLSTSGIEEDFVMKLAMLIGGSGTGKGYIVEQLHQPHQRIVVDHVRRDVLVPLRPVLSGDECNQWPVWDALIPHFDVVPAMAKTIATLYPKLDSNTPIVAEGGLLAHTPFRYAFLSALARLQYHITIDCKFWIDPDPQQILENRRKRSERRKSDRDVTIEEVRSAVMWYRSVAGQLDSHRFHDAASAAAAIDQFLIDPFDK